MTDALMLSAAFLVAGFAGPWWGCALIALAYGFWRGDKFPRKTLFVWVLAAVAGAWSVPALLQDLPVGGRVSARIAGILLGSSGVRSTVVSYFAGYLATLALGSIPAILGLSAGIDLRLAIRPPSRPAAEDTPED